MTGQSIAPVDETCMQPTYFFENLTEGTGLEVRTSFISQVLFFSTGENFKTNIDLSLPQQTTSHFFESFVDFLIFRLVRQGKMCRLLFIQLKQREKEGGEKHTLKQAIPFFVSDHEPGSSTVGFPEWVLKVCAYYPCREGKYDPYPLLGAALNYGW